jgi:hypothetical protein
MLYAQESAQLATATGLPTGVTTPTSYTNGALSGGKRRTKLVQYNTASQNLASGSVINVGLLDAGVVPVAITVITDTALSSSTIQVGLGGTASYFTSSAVSTASAGKVDAFTNLTNFGQPTTANVAPQIVTATIGGATWTTGNIYFLIDYLEN